MWAGTGQAGRQAGRGVPTYSACVTSDDTAGNAAHLSRAAVAPRNKAKPHQIGRCHKKYVFTKRFVE